MPRPVEGAIGVMTDVLDIDVEHFIPEEQDGHVALSTCPCGPLRVTNVRGWYHVDLHA